MRLNKFFIVSAVNVSECIGMLVGEVYFGNPTSQY